MVKLIMVWLFGAAIFTLGNVYAASPDRPTDEDAIGTRAEITLIQAILDDEDEDEDLQDDEDLQEDQDDLDGERDTQDEEDEDDLEDSSRQWTTPT
jgi:midasin (ATPase involved in ribosome maturation)